MKKKKILKSSHKVSHKKRPTRSPEPTMAMLLLKLGRLMEAELESAKILKSDPGNAEALYVKGIIEYKRGNLQVAWKLLHQAVSKKPDFANAHLAYGTVMNDLGAHEEAIAAYEKALELGMRKPELYNKLGNTLNRMGELEKSTTQYLLALELDGNYLLAHFNLGIVLRLQGKLSEALKSFKKALELNPSYFMALDNLGTIYDDLKELDKAELCYRKSIQINTKNPVAYNNLANVLRQTGQFDEAEDNCKKALDLNNNFAPAYKNLGTIYQFQGMPDEAITYYRKSVNCSSDPITHSNILLTMHYPSEITQGEIFEESLRWRELFETESVKGNAVLTNTPNASRRLKIGYVSPDFRDHSVASFIEQVLRNHDRRQVEVFCYSNTLKPDNVTKRLKGETDRWRDIIFLDDSRVVQLVKEDGIDILVDLAGHTGGNRLAVFAKKPAPLQVTWLGYPNTTGLQNMDYRLTDDVADPPGIDDHLNSESLLRPESGFLCYNPDASAPLVGPLPFLNNQHITLGCFNNLLKITLETIQLWIDIMLTLPGSRLIIKNESLAIPETAARYAKIFESGGISRDRIEMMGMLPAKKDHLDLYNKIDISLDTSPYNGTTTTCESLWMGVPVVTLRGNRHSTRVGASIMNRVGLNELVAETPRDYRNLVVALARDHQRLVELRRGLRKRLERSPLLDGESFTANLENTYREIWGKWCLSACR